MIELKEHQFCECDEIVREYRGQLSNEMRSYYLKSEADKVIAAKDKVIAYARALVLEDIRLIRHHKFKRCLDKAAWCELKSEIYDEFAADADEYMPSYAKRFRRKAEFYQNWRKRWLELAEQFKEAK